MKLVVEIDDSGNVTRSTVYVGPLWPCSTDLDSRVNEIMREAEKAALAFKFSPAIKDGKPVDSKVSLSLKIGSAAKNKIENPQLVDPDAPPVPKRISGGVLNGRATTLEKPRYPPEARAAGAAGAVSVQVLLDVDGKILSAQAVSGHRLLQFAAREAACRSKFPSTRLQGQPVMMSGAITYNFVP